MEKRLFITAASFAGLGLTAGLFERIYVDQMGMSTAPHLAVLHTHLLALGFLFFLIALAIERSFRISQQAKLFNLFYWHYLGGLLLTVIGMFLIGMIEASNGGESKMLAGVSGLGHIIITVGIGFFLAAIGKSIKK